MSEKKKSWDDIPSLGDGGVDWDFAPENPLGKRKYVRMNEVDLTSMFEEKMVKVKLITKKHNIVGSLCDVGEGGVGLKVKGEFAINQYVKIGFFLGRQKIISRAIVKQSRRLGNNYRIGLQFVDLREEYREFIAGLYASKKLVP